MVAVVVAVLQGPLSGNAGVAEHGLRAIANLAEGSKDNKQLFGAAGGCKGEWVTVVDPIVFMLHCGASDRSIILLLFWCGFVSLLLQWLLHCCGDDCLAIRMLQSRVSELLLQWLLTILITIRNWVPRELARVSE